jgi:predicted phage terminase large subunit-like protein
MLFRARRALLQQDLAEFLREAWPIVEGARVLKWNWHIDVICQHLEALDNGTLGKNKLLVNVPPRTSKSTILSVAFPAWVWTRKPHLQFLFASYSFDLSSELAEKRKLLLESPWYQERWGEKVSLLKDRNSVARVMNMSKGKMLTTSISGSVTGKGGDYLILDDPNSAVEMESEQQRQSCLNFVDGAWASRANDANTVREIVIQQRTHEQDVTGHYLKKSPEEWVHLKIPMEYHAPSVDRPACVTPLWKETRSQEGEILDPIRFPAEYLKGQLVSLGSYRYAGQYDQEPAPLGGGIVKDAWLKKWRRNADGLIVLPGLDRGGDYKFSEWGVTRFATVDLAFTDDEIGEKKLDDPDYCVFGAFAAFIWRHLPVVVLLDLIRERMEGPAMLSRLEAFHQHWKFAVIGFETIQAQKALFQFARKMGLPVREISTRRDPDSLYTIDKDKVSRLVAATPTMEQGRFFIPEYAPWVMEYRQELTRFPNSAHDDQTDISSYAIPIAKKVGSIIDPAPRVGPERPKAPKPMSVQAMGPEDWRAQFGQHSGIGGKDPTARPENDPGLVNNFGADGT